MTCPLRSTEITPLLHCFLRKAFERTNGIKTQLLNAAQQKELDETFSAISDTVKEIQRSAPNVTLGGMLAIVRFESGVRPGFFNTRDKENSYSPDRKNKLPKLDPTKKPYWQQPLARYSYQFGIIPIHTSIFRPCLAATRAARLRFDNLAKQQGFAPTADQLASIRPDFEEVCQKAQSPVPDEPRAVNYFMLNAHSNDSYDDVLEWCRRLKALLADAPKAPNSIAFADRIAEIERAAKTRPEWARESLFVLEVALTKADDENGAAIINADRYRRLFPERPLDG